jgi:Holliday junction resolvase
MVTKEKGPAIIQGQVVDVGGYKGEFTLQVEVKASRDKLNKLERSSCSKVGLAKLHDSQEFRDAFEKETISLKKALRLGTIEIRYID